MSFPDPGGATLCAEFFAGYSSVIVETVETLSLFRQQITFNFYK